ncbi:MAG: multidrug transporter [Lachnospiraceae bacterium]|nr:multidrug transporter [Lachnospiraceae bacterium]
MSRIRLSLHNINYRLFGALLVLGLVPSVYTTVRVFFLGQLPGDYAYSIAGQLSWVNLLYEVLNEAIILPLFYFVGKVREDRAEFTNRVKTGMIITFSVYIILSALMHIFAKPLLKLMAADTSILELSASYIRIESIANIFMILSQFALVVLISINKSRYLYVLTGARLVLCLISDTFLVSDLPVSANLGVNGIGYSNIIVNVVLFGVSLIFLAKEGIRVLTRNKLKYTWMKEFFRVGGISGLESFVRNFAYMVMIARMVNVVGEQGTYWVANNFIWGWLLLPVIQLGELIKQEVAADRDNVQRNTPGYLAITLMISGLWFATIPAWKPFMSRVLGFDEVEKLFELVILLVGFYVLYAVQNVFDSIFYGLGKTDYMLFESVITNVVYYGVAFVLYVTNVWTPTLTGIALLFGIGNAFDSVVSLFAFLYLMRKEKIGNFWSKKQRKSSLIS